jgi:hypothetical protein
LSRLFHNCPDLVCGASITEKQVSAWVLDRFADADPVAQEAEVRESKNGPPRAAIVWNFVLAGQETSERADLLVVTISEDGHSLVLPSAERAGFLRRGLALVEGEELTNTKLLNLQADMRDDPQLARADLAQRALARPDRGCNGGALFALG